MKIKMNVAQLEASIQQTAEKAIKGASEKMRRRAIKIRDLAREFAPVDDGDLESAIDYVTLKDGKNRNQFVVYVDPDVAAGPDGKVTGDYALLIERGMAPYGSGQFHLGPRSIAKGGKVGGRYMKRAFEEGTEGLEQEIAGEVRRVVGGGRGLISSNQNALKSQRDYEGADE